MKRLYSFLFIVLISLACIGQSKEDFPTTFDEADVVITNEQHLVEFLKDFKDGAKYYKVNYNPTLQDLTKVVLVRSELNFLGGVIEIEGKKEIWLNSMLLQHP